MWIWTRTPHQKKKKLKKKNPAAPGGQGSQSCSAFGVLLPKPKGAQQSCGVMGSPLPPVCCRCPLGMLHQAAWSSAESCQPPRPNALLPEKGQMPPGSKASSSLILGRSPGSCGLNWKSCLLLGPALFPPGASATPSGPCAPGVLVNLLDQTGEPTGGGKR